MPRGGRAHPYLLSGRKRHEEPPGLVSNARVTVLVGCPCGAYKARLVGTGLWYAIYVCTRCKQKMVGPMKPEWGDRPAGKTGGENLRKAGLKGSFYFGRGRK